MSKDKFALTRFHKSKSQSLWIINEPKQKKFVNDVTVIDAPASAITRATR